MLGMIKAVAVLCAVLPAGAAAQETCFDRDVLKRVIGGEYGESPASAGIDGGGNLVEVWSNRDTGTWTLIVTTPGGASCVIGMGEAWQSFDPAPTGEHG